MKTLVWKLEDRRRLCEQLAKAHGEKPTANVLRYWASLLRWGDLRIVTPNELKQEKRTFVKYKEMEKR